MPKLVYNRHQLFAIGNVIIFDFCKVSQFHTPIFGQRSTKDLFIDSISIANDGLVWSMQVLIWRLVLKKNCNSSLITLSVPYNTSVLSARPLSGKGNSHRCSQGLSDY